MQFIGKWNHNDYIYKSGLKYIIRIEIDKSMKRLLLAILLVSFAFCMPAQDLRDIQGSMQVYFSPSGGCAEAIVNSIASAKESILVQAYSFTSSPIAKALVDAHKRGVVCKVILDKSQRTEKYSEADFLVHSGIETWIDAEHRIAHNKVMVIDGQIVITGSFNFTKSAETGNAENLLVIRCPELAQKYTEKWKNHEKHSMVYESKR